MTQEQLDGWLKIHRSLTIQVTPRRYVSVGANTLGPPLSYWLATAEAVTGGRK